MSEPISEPVGFGVLGGNSFVATAAVIPAIEASEGAELVVVGSRSGSIGYDDVLVHPDVDIVYLPLPNGMHAAWTTRAAKAGKHVLCEKPLAPSAAVAADMVRTCTAAGVRLFEAWMTPFSPPWAEAVGAAAPIADRIESRFTFTIGPGNESNYRWDPSQGGGALLDVGVYALGPAVEMWGAEPATIEADSHLTERGVDLTTNAILTWPGGQVCSITVSFGLPEAQMLTITGPGFGRTLSGDAHTGVDGTYTRMIDAVCADLSGQSAFPRPIDDAVTMLSLIDRIRTS